MCFWEAMGVGEQSISRFALTDVFSYARLLILMCAAAVDFISNNDNHSARWRAPKAAQKLQSVNTCAKKEKENQKLFTNVRIFCPTKKKTYKFVSKRKRKNFEKLKKERRFLAYAKNKQIMQTKAYGGFI